MDADLLPPESTMDAPRRSMQRLVLPGVELYCGDCRDILPIKADALISDPPYGMRIDAGRLDDVKAQKQGMRRNKYKECEWDAEDYDANALLSWWPKTKPIALFGADYYRNTLPDGGSWMVWDKKMPGMEELPGSDFELCWVRPTTKRRMLRKVWTGYLSKELDEERLHPTQKPVAVMGMVMNAMRIPEGATVLDPYMGSGSTIIAAIRTGRKAIGIEKDPEHFKNACERIKRELAQGDLFLGQNEIALAPMPATPKA
jgi:DNA modification methylase